MARPRCERCGRTEHVIDGDGPTICRVCLFAWGAFLGGDPRGRVVREVAAPRSVTRPMTHPMAGCPLCPADRLRGAPSFDGWLRGRNA